MQRRGDEPPSIPSPLTPSNVECAPLEWRPTRVGARAPRSPSHEVRCFGSAHGRTVQWALSPPPPALPVRGSGQLAQHVVEDVVVEAGLSEPHGWAVPTAPRAGELAGE